MFEAKREHGPEGRKRRNNMFGNTEERKRKSAVAQVGLKGAFLDIKVGKDETVCYLKDKSIGGPIKGATASVQTEGEIRDRFTATRILAIGIFALAFKKKTSDKDVFVVIEHPEYVITSHVPSKKEADARAFARAFNALNA
jgi:hypothetical protein